MSGARGGCATAGAVVRQAGGDGPAGVRGRRARRVGSAVPRRAAAAAPRATPRAAPPAPAAPRAAAAARRAAAAAAGTHAPYVALA